MAFQSLVYRAQVSCRGKASWRMYSAACENEGSVLAPALTAAAWEPSVPVCIALCRVFSPVPDLCSLPGLHCSQRFLIENEMSTKVYSTFSVPLTDRVLGLESPIISSKPQSRSLTTPGKSEAEHLFVTATQFVKEQHANGTLKEDDGSYPIPIPEPHMPVSEERWALDALRNCKFYS